MKISSALQCWRFWDGSQARGAFCEIYTHVARKGSVRYIRMFLEGDSVTDIRMLLEGVL